MATAKISSPEGLTIDIDGTPQEIAEAVDAIRKNLAPAQTKRAPQPKAGKTSIADLVSQLKAEEFFRQPRGLGEIQGRFAELGYHYPITTLSGAMQSQARRRELRRFKEAGKFVYAQ